MPTGQANSTRWFHRDGQAQDAAAVKFLTDKLARLDQALAIAFPNGKVSNQKLKTEAAVKKKLLKTALDYVRGKRAYLSTWKAGPMPKTEDAFVALVMREAADIPAMFERAKIPLETHEAIARILTDNAEVIQMLKDA
jgi:hypothetical protein